MRHIIHVLLAMLGLALTGCSTVTDWISPAETTPPAELRDIVAKVDAEPLWSTDTGAGSDDRQLRLAPYYLDGRIYVADATGKVTALDATTGRALWSVDLDVPISGGPGAGAGLLAVGTLDAEVIALSLADGSLKWRAPVSSEVLARPAIGERRVVVRTIDGKVQGLDATTGEERWRYEREIPVLTLRGTSDPIVSGDHVLCGMAGGKLINLDLRTGAVRWDVTVSVPSGRSELERLADIDANPLVLGGLVFVATYQGEVAALEEASGEILWRRRFSSYSGMAADRYNVYASDSEGLLWALDADNGSARWRQDALKNRQLSDVAVLSGTVAVGDFEGYVHFLSTEDGSLVGRTRVGSAPITHGILVADGILYVMGDDGDLAALKLVPVK